MTDDKWTVVRHSAWAVGRNPQFERGLETRQVSTKGQQAMVIEAGGMLFDGYGQAEGFAEKAMYPSGTPGLIPAARGDFADRTIDGLQIYIPVPLRPLRLPFGLSEAIPEGVTAAWGARLIVTQDGDVDLPSDRQGAAGEGRQEFLALLDAEVPLPTLLDAVSKLLREGSMQTRLAEDFRIVRNSAVEVHADTNGSAGYCYLAAFPTQPGRPELVDDDKAGPQFVSSCCRAGIEVTRPVSDVVRFIPERLEDGTLWVRYGNVLNGEAGDFTARCSACNVELDTEVEED